MGQRTGKTQAKKYAQSYLHVKQLGRPPLIFILYLPSQTMGWCKGQRPVSLSSYPSRCLSTIVIDHDALPPSPRNRSLAQRALEARDALLTEHLATLRRVRRLVLDGSLVSEKREGHANSLTDHNEFSLTARCSSLLHCLVNALGASSRLVRK